MPKVTLPDRLKQARDAKGLNQTQLADVLGLDKSTVSHWEAGVAAPRKKYLRDISKVLAIPRPELDRLYIEFVPPGKAA